MNYNSIKEVLAQNKLGRFLAMCREVDRKYRLTGLACLRDFMALYGYFNKTYMTADLETHYKSNCTKLDSAYSISHDSSFCYWSDGGRFTDFGNDLLATPVGIVHYDPRFNSSRKIINQQVESAMTWTYSDRDPDERVLNFYTWTSHATS